MRRKTNAARLTRAIRELEIYLRCYGDDHDTDEAAAELESLREQLNELEGRS